MNEIDGLSRLFGYNSFLVVIQAAALFEIIKESSIKGKLSVLLEKIGEASFGIYIVHMFFVNCFYKLIKINPFDMWGGYTIAVLVLINLIFSYVTTIILKRIHFFKSFFKEM